MCAPRGLTLGDGQQVQAQRVLLEAGEAGPGRRPKQR
jgi:hypothetical protein